jgi:NAD(P)-dependent dehydrogenase (short-subunit alcohol dehydrogenase family)
MDNGAPTTLEARHTGARDRVGTVEQTRARIAAPIRIPLEPPGVPVTDAPSQPIAPGTLTGKVALVTGSSRGIGADTVRYFAQAGADVVINYRNKAPRAEKLANEVRELGVKALVVGADLTDTSTVQAMFEAVQEEFGGLDILVLNASGGMESGMEEDYALKLNRDAQVGALQAALPLLREGSRVVFVTSHQAHFIRTTPTMPEYEPVALSKRAGEDALRELIPSLEEKGIGFTVVSGDMIEGTITATLLERANPGAIAQRRESAGKLYNVSEFAAEVARAAVDPVPADNTRLVGDVSAFAGE